MKDIDRALYEVSPLAKALNRPIRIFSNCSRSSKDSEIDIKIVSEIKKYNSLEVQFDLVEDAPNDATSFEHSISERLFRSSPSLEKSYVPKFRKIQISAERNCSLNIYDYGDTQATVALLAIPCGMPVILAEKWILKLSKKYRVVTWESRGMFGKCEDFDCIETSLEAQAEDIERIFKAFGIEAAHLLGLCGGAAIALCAAAKYPKRFLSLSFWHADFDFGGATKKSMHQKDMMAMLSRVAKSRDAAKSMYALFCRPSVLENIRRDISHVILYPYSSPEMIYRYGKLNGNVMTTNLQKYLEGISQSSLFVTSREDVTAHPDGSEYAKNCIKDACLVEMESGDHSSLFDASDELIGHAFNFLESHE